MNNAIDHFTIGTHALETGAAAMLQLLGVQPPRGSKHEAMSTHNCVMQAGEGCFFELMAIDPEAPPPPRARWFSFDDPQTRQKIAARPRALGWVVRTDDLDAIVAASPVDLGEVVTFIRGTRSWRLTVPKDGSLVEGGLIPAFIEWSPGPHPSLAQADLGVRLQRIILTHPDAPRIQALLEALSITHLANVQTGPAGLSFRLDTPKGRISLD